ncbi:hypothetical protein DSM110093_02718 [Sulfitobacter sp. DSM 110093]|uniref:tripartite tricarboxylate transporter TctB family protein n=1 Tax=Sulfitobacter sp. DSM 110093 TaxID=2883127 RepID=UPI001FAC7002|nr:tripartite tricarboxylate transporter TctB family protein [Sulfitobacter sp. DSM 110093]UOA32911.1 hypothetical protein DSM110093_02718 [Sulfitobacter sp. DSM 110093]
MQIQDTAIGLLLSVLGVTVIWHVGSFPMVAGQNYGPDLFPRLAGIGLLFCGSGLVLRGVRARNGIVTLIPGTDTRRGIIAAVYIVASVLSIVVLAEPVGLQILVFVIVLSGLLAAWRRPLAALVLALGLTVAFDAIFRLLLRVPLPSGLLEGML